MAFPEDVGDTGSIPKSGRSPGEGNGCPLQYSAQFSRSVVSDSLRPHEPQHAGPPCPSPTPGVHPDARPLSQLLESNGGNINNSSSQWRPPPRETAEALSGSSLFSCPGLWQRRFQEALYFHVLVLRPARCHVENRCLKRLQRTAESP